MSFLRTISIGTKLMAAFALMAGCFVDIAPLSNDAGAGGRGGAGSSSVTSGGAGGLDSECADGSTCVEAPGGATIVIRPMSDDCPLGTTIHPLRVCDACSCKVPTAGGCTVMVHLFDNAACRGDEVANLPVTDACEPIDGAMAAPAESIGVRALASSTGGLVCNASPSTVGSTPSFVCAVDDATPCGVAGSCVTASTSSCLLLSDARACPVGYDGDLLADTTSDVQCGCKCDSCAAPDFVLFDADGCAGADAVLPANGACQASSLILAASLQDGSDASLCTPRASPPVSPVRLCCPV